MFAVLANETSTQIYELNDGIYQRKNCELQDFSSSLEQQTETKL
jgi:hypothetical protein